MYYIGLNMGSVTCVSH